MGIHNRCALITDSLSIYCCCDGFFALGLHNPILCVEPNADMLRVAETREGVQPYLASADSFFQADCNTLPKCNKILLNECAHLFPDTQESFRKAHEYLPADGLLLLIQRSSVCSFPMWKALKAKFAIVSMDTFRSYLEKAEFDITVTVEVGISKMAKGEWYDKLRRRIFTILHEFSDEQIEEGLKELDQEWFPGAKESDIVEIKDNIAYFAATKKK